MCLMLHVFMFDGLNIFKDKSRNTSRSLFLIPSVHFTRGCALLDPDKLTVYVSVLLLFFFLHPICPFCLRATLKSCSVCSVMYFLLQMIIDQTCERADAPNPILSSPSRCRRTKSLYRVTRKFVACGGWVCAYYFWLSGWMCENSNTVFILLAFVLFISQCLSPLLGL